MAPATEAPAAPDGRSSRRVADGPAGADGCGSSPGDDCARRDCGSHARRGDSGCIGPASAAHVCD